MNYKPTPKGAKTILQEIRNGVFDKKQLAKKTGYSISTVYHYLSICGKTKQRNIKSTKSFISIQTYNILNMLKNGEKGSKIARKFGVSRQWVSKIKLQRLKGD